MLVTPDWCRIMARYNAWQNAGLVELVPTLPPEELTRDRGAFWGSILGTLSHLLWGDRIWLHRLSGTARPEQALPDSGRMVTDAGTWAKHRAATDAAITAWTDGLTPADLEGEFTWTSPAAGRVVSKPRAVIVTHVFNHQTHHRGQVHAMLTAAGLRPGATDLPFMPDEEPRP
jgi:uncharacterized damage-inducible protein DinB